MTSANVSEMQISKKLMTKHETQCYLQSFILMCSLIHMSVLWTGTQCFSLSTLCETGFFVESELLQIVR